MQKNNNKFLISFIVMVFISIISLFTIFQFLVSSQNQKKLSKQQIIQEAKAHFQSMVDARSWNAKFGGVYVKSKDGLKPNPYLKNNILYTDKNETLIKINPAWMTRQISEISNKQGSYHFKITSLLPINPSNRADEFETKALKYFEKHKDHKYFYRFNNETNSFNFMGSLVVTESCMKCHRHQGYSVGDIRGGIRVSIPTKLYNKNLNMLEEKTKDSIALTIIISLIFLILSFWFISLIYKRKFEIEHSNEILEDKVSKRTIELEVAIAHEQHLKDVLKITTEVNEMLITSYSTKTILKSATNKLANNREYPLVVSAIITDELMEIVSKSSEIKDLIQDDFISLNDLKNSNYLYEAIKKSIRLKHPIIEKIIPKEDVDKLNRREDDLELEWIMTLPLLHGFENDVYGIIIVFCSRETGFELEEMKILENMAHDISIALHSHSQRNSILEMEKEKIANYEETILAFVNIIEQRDTYTAGHTIRVAEYCSLIAHEMEFSEDDIHRLEKAAILHDIGKVATPDSILLKPGQLSRLEYELIKQHSAVGADMLEKITIYQDLAAIIRFHHARYDGKGYPKTISPDEIPMLSHIMIVADAFDAMTTNRIYRPRKCISEALEEIVSGSGTQFHPDVIEASLIALKDVNVSDTNQLPVSELEKRRMSYFFQDGLTELYNEDYLHMIFNSDNYSFSCINIIKLKKFTSYNQNYGWDAGNDLLRKFAKSIQKVFSTSTIIRYHGDDFIVLSKMHINVDSIYTLELLKDAKLEVNIDHYDISSDFTYEAFQDLENN